MCDRTVVFFAPNGLVYHLKYYVIFFCSYFRNRFFTKGLADSDYVAFFSENNWACFGSVIFIECSTRFLVHSEAYH